MLMVDNHNVDSLCAKLDERYRNEWDLYRTALGKWAVKLGAEVFSADTIAEALESAAAYKPLPIIPPRPELRSFSGYQAVKTGSNWKLTYHGTDVGCYSIPTKRQAMAIAERFAKANEAEIVAWDNAYGYTVLSGTEGVDFRYGY